MNKQQALTEAQLAISYLIAQHKKDGEYWPENVPNYYLEQAEKLTALYQYLNEWQAEIGKRSKQD